MFDLTIDATEEAGGRVRYALGPKNWQDRRIPDIRGRSPSVQVPESRLVDVILLGDGFESAGDFMTQLEGWLRDFSRLEVYAKFAGAFRIRALHEPSTEAASTRRDSYYRCRVQADGEGISVKDTWWAAGDADGLIFRERLFAAVDSFSGVNLRRYPTDLDLGNGDTAIKSSTLQGVYRNLVVCMLVRTSASANVSGMARPVPRLAPAEDRLVRVAFGGNRIHEFSHAFALLSDEYIDGRGATSSRVNHPLRSVFTLTNHTYSAVDGEVPWQHLGPWGRESRQAAGEAPDPLVGWLWVGGGKHRNVWHAEYRCLMNGTHDNFRFTQIAADDPTANADGSYTEESGANLRDGQRFCLWCQEIATIRILEKTDQLEGPGDSADLNVAGVTWWTRWESLLRERYWALFDVSRQIADSETTYAAMTPGPSGEPLWRSDLYSAYTASPRAATNPVSTLSDAELNLLLLDP